ncbi:SAM-dependent methyltransferase [Streptosporangium becharense]|uniref:SAM-dependent methyltransferase n=1 Tax=Streptosporangium becharense TaxID=1816182 RepID=A0A7W9IC74_9ACTN|nr:class I SAM-dependent methyltransferase [Streptosporangium becharense]MBB2910768.1 SAM-dependent methyltransferase [Streptosporangium becharense]MBB5817463.1 SAM-dependent methyltransferase [Streptosporangium becharense]
MEPAKVGAIFDATHAEFALLSPHLWDPIGEASVAAAGIGPGDRVLDVCCGAGASAIPAAAASGASGSVDAIDLAESLLEQGRRRAAVRGLDTVRFIRADATRWVPADGEPYDLVLCVHGIFFLPDMDAAAARLAGLLRPGGRFTVTTWAKGALERFGMALHAAVERERGTPPESPSNRDSVTRIDSEDGMHAWLAGLGLVRTRVRRVPLTVPLTADLAWLLVIGSGFRGMLDGMEPEAVVRVREGLLGLLDERGIDSVDATSLVGVGVVTRP